MFRELVVRHQAYLMARRKKPYNKDIVQALGMRFAQEWNARKADIIAFAKITEDEFDYNLHHTVMPLIVAGEDNVQSLQSENEAQ